MDDEIFTAFSGLIAIGLIAVMIALPIRMVRHHYDVNSCRIFADQSSYETKFVDYNFFQWDCLAHRDDGKWVSRDNLRDMQ